MLRSLMSHVITRAGHQVCAATDGRHALELLQATPDIVVTDIEMPFVDGIELVTHIRKTHPDLPVMVLSGGNPVLLRKAALAGANVCLTKPVDMALFVARLEQLLAQASGVAEPLEP